MKDLRILPKVRDSWSYLYVEHCRIDQEAKAIAIHNLTGKFPVPCSTLTLLMLGTGTTITHAAIMSAGRQWLPSRLDRRRRCPFLRARLRRDEVRPSSPAAGVAVLSSRSEIDRGDASVPDEVQGRA